MIILGSLVLIELFSRSIMTEALRVNIDWKSAISLQHGRFYPKFHVEGVTPHQLFFFSKNYLWVKWYFVWYYSLDWFFFYFVTIHAFDRQTDSRQTEFSLLDHVCIPCSMVKIMYHVVWLVIHLSQRTFYDVRR